MLGETRMGMDSMSWVLILWGPHALFENSKSSVDGELIFHTINSTHVARISFASFQCASCFLSSHSSRFWYWSVIGDLSESISESEEALIL